MGYQVGIRMLDLIVVRERNLKRETKILNILLFIKGTFWKVTMFFYGCMSSKRTVLSWHDAFAVVVNERFPKLHYDLKCPDL